MNFQDNKAQNEIIRDIPATDVAEDIQFFDVKALNDECAELEAKLIRKLGDDRFNAFKEQGVAMIGDAHTLWERYEEISHKAQEMTERYLEQIRIQNTHTSPTQKELQAAA